MDLSSIFSGGASKLIDSVGNTINKLFTSDEEREQAKTIMVKLKGELELQGKQLDAEYEERFAKLLNERIAQHEGTASDLKIIPFLGPLMLFLRGAQRPIWGFGVLYMDFMIFSGAWTLKVNEAGGGMQENAFWVINFLVLGFLFGERAIKNVLPLVNQFLANRSK
jgi:hypothetical protein